MSPNLLNIIHDAFNADTAHIHDDLELASLDGWDSMSHMLFITKLESEYGIQLTGEDIVTMRTVGAIRETLNRHDCTA